MEGWKSRFWRGCWEGHCACCQSFAGHQSCLPLTAAVVGPSLCAGHPAGSCKNRTECTIFTIDTQMSVVHDKYPLPFCWILLKVLHWTSSWVQQESRMKCITPGSCKQYQIYFQLGPVNSIKYFQLGPVNRTSFEDCFYYI